MLNQLNKKLKLFGFSIGDEIGHYEFNMELIDTYISDNGIFYDRYLFPLGARIKGLNQDIINEIFLYFNVDVLEAVFIKYKESQLQNIFKLIDCQFSKENELKIEQSFFESSNKLRLSSNEYIFLSKGDDHITGLFYCSKSFIHNYNV